MAIKADRLRKREKHFIVTLQLWHTISRLILYVSTIFMIWQQQQTFAGLVLPLIKECSKHFLFFIFYPVTEWCLFYFILIYFRLFFIQCHQEFNPIKKFLKPKDWNKSQTELMAARVVTNGLLHVNKVAGIFQESFFLIKSVIKKGGHKAYCSVEHHSDSLDKSILKQ